MVHRDLTPRNVFLCDDGQVKILDFGLAHAFGQRKVGGGTAAYMAPEQLSDAPEDERTDVFALGVILHQLLTGELPAIDDDAHATASAVAEVAREWHGLPELVGRMLEKNPLQRPRDGRSVLAELIQVEQGAVNSPADRAVRGTPHADLPQPRTKSDRRTRHNRTPVKKRICQRLKLAHAKGAGTPIDVAATRLAHGVEHQAVMMERYPDADVAVNDRPDVIFVRRATGEGVEAGAVSAAPTDSKDEKASFVERWVREREGYRDGGY